MEPVRININMDKKCAECGKGGAADSGICSICSTKAISGKPMRSAVGRAVAERFQQFMRSTR